MAFTVVYDANVLYPSMLRDLLIRLAMTGMVRARWTERILDETFRNLSANRPDLDAAKLVRTRALMCLAFRTAWWKGMRSLRQRLVPFRMPTTST